MLLSGGLVAFLTLLTSQRAVVMEPGERRLATLVQQLNTIRNAKLKKREESSARRKLAHAKKTKVADDAMQRRLQEEKKRRYREEGKRKAAAAAPRGAKRAKKMH